MNKFVKFLTILIALLAMSSSAALAGHSGVVNFGPVEKAGYVANVFLDDVVFLEGDGNPGYSSAYQETNGNWMLRYNSEVFKGAKVFVLGTQELWKGGKRSANVDVSNALGSAKLDTQEVVVNLRHSVPGADNYYAVLIFMVEMANGKRGWFVPYGSGQFIVRNRLDEAQTLVVISKEKGLVFAPDEKGRKLAAQRE